MSEDEAKTLLETPIPHDGKHSRRWIGSSIAASFVFLVATGLLLFSGHWAEKPFFDQAYWIKSLWVCCGILAFGWGLMTVDKAIEMLRMVLPFIGKGKGS